MINEWLNLLKGSIASEFGNKFSVMLLATVSRNGSPRVRAVVCRAIDDDGTFWLVSDKRSRKNRQIRAEANVEAVFWLPKARRQYRIRGKAKIVDAEHRRARELWKEIPDATRALFTWPTPGRRPVDPDDRFTKAVSYRAVPPKSFQAIAIKPTLVEELNLKPHPHRRRRWRRKSGWKSEAINP